MTHSIANCWNAIGRLATAVIAGGCMLYVIDAPAAQRTFVASYGDDSNACSLVAPCRSFGTAMTQVDPGGEVVVLDSAGYGPVVIAQSVSIIAPPGVYAGITASAGITGIRINGAGIIVTLRGLSLNGLAGSLDGIRFQQGAAMRVERCIVSGFGGTGILALDPGTISIKDTEIRDNGNYGIHAVLVNAPEVLRVTVDRTRIERNTLAGIRVQDNARALVKDTIIAGNNTQGISVFAADAGNTAEVVVENSAITGNGIGISAGGGVAVGTHRVIVSNSTVSWNTTGWDVENDPGTNLYTRGNNTVRFNNTNQAGKAEIVLAGD